MSGSVNNDVGFDNSLWDTQTKENDKQEERVPALLQDATESGQRDSTKVTDTSRGFQDQPDHAFSLEPALGSPNNSRDLLNGDQLAVNTSFLPAWLSDGATKFGDAVKDRVAVGYLNSLIGEELKGKVGLNLETISKIAEGDKEALKQFGEQAVSRIKEDPSLINDYVELGSKLLSNEQFSQKIRNLLSNSSLSPEAKIMLNQFLNKPDKVQDLKLSSQELAAVEVLKQAGEAVGSDLGAAFNLISSGFGSDSVAQEAIGKAKGQLYSKIESAVDQKAGLLGKLFGIAEKSKAATRGNIIDDLPGLTFASLGDQRETKSALKQAGFDLDTLLTPSEKMSHEQARIFLVDYAEADLNRPLKEGEQEQIAKAFFSLDSDRVANQAAFDMERTQYSIGGLAKASDIPEGSYTKLLNDGVLNARALVLNNDGIYDPEQLRDSVKMAQTTLAQGLSERASELGLNLNDVQAMVQESRGRLPTGFVQEDVDTLFASEKDQSIVDTAHNYAYFKSEDGQLYSVAKEHGWAGKRVDGQWQAIDLGLEQQLRAGLAAKGIEVYGVGRSSVDVANTIFQKAQASFIENGYQEVSKDQFYGDYTEAKEQAGDRFKFFMKGDEKIAVSKNTSWTGKWDGREWVELTDSQEKDLRDYIKASADPTVQDLRTKLVKDENSFLKKFDARADASRLQQIAWQVNPIYENYQNQGYYDNVTYQQAQNTASRVGRVKPGNKRNPYR